MQLSLSIYLCIHTRKENVAHINLMAFPELRGFLFYFYFGCEQ